MVMQYGQQQMLLLHACGALQASLQHGQLQDVAGFLVQHQVSGVDGLSYLVLPDARLQLGLHGLHADVQPLEYLHDWTVLHAHDTQQQVLWSNAAAGQPTCLLARVS